MQAVAKTQAAPGSVEVVEVERPVAGPGEVLLRNVGGGVCGTDIGFWHWHDDMAREYKPRLPVVMGHEFGGHVAALGANVDDLAVGDLVAVNPHLTCGVCRHCTEGALQLCLNRAIMGLQANGGWAEYTVVPRRNVQILPPSTAPEVAALMEPLAVAVHAVNERCPTRPGDTVLVQGAGPVGLLHLLVARASGAREVIVTGLGADGERLALAEALGGIPINVEREDTAAAVKRIRPGGADVAYETSGGASALQGGLAALARGGRMALVGFCHAAFPFESMPVVLEEKEIYGCRAYNPATWRRAAALVGTLHDDLRKLVSHQLPITEANRAFELVEARQCLKVVLHPA